MSKNAVARAASLIQQMLAFSRKQTLDLRSVDVNSLVSQMADMLRRTLGENIRLQLSLEPEVCPARSDSTQLEAAVLNLGINARDAMPHGGLLHVSTGRVTIDPGSPHRELAPGTYVRLGVSDTGSGMPADVVDKAFDPFFTTKPIGKGTGLGLSMIYGFARQTGGYAEISSTLGQGTTVNLYLPCDVHHSPPPDQQATADVDVPVGAGEAILVVEDEPGVRAVIGDVLTSLGYVYFEAVDGATALAALNAIDRIDLLLTDVGLPGINGRRLAEIARERHPGLKVLLMTGYAREARVRADFLGTDMDMMAKPFSIDALARKIRDMLERSPADLRSPEPG